GSFTSYQWLKDGANITGATQQTYTVQAPGNYWVRVVNNTGCNGESAPMWVPYVLSMSQLTGNDIYLYPNPTKDIVQIQYHQPLHVKVFNAVGQLAYENDRTLSIPMSHLA